MAGQLGLQTSAHGQNCSSDEGLCLDAIQTAIGVEYYMYFQTPEETAKVVAKLRAWAKARGSS